MPADANRRPELTTQGNPVSTKLDFAAVLMREREVLFPKRNEDGARVDNSSQVEQQANYLGEEKEPPKELSTLVLCNIAIRDVWNVEYNTLPQPVGVYVTACACWPATPGLVPATQGLGLSRTGTPLASLPMATDLRALTQL